jgi:hypothetical protein
VEYQEAEEGSPLNRIKRLIEVRRETSEQRTGEVGWLQSEETVLAYRRDGVAHVANLGDKPATVDVGEGWEVAHATQDVKLLGPDLTLPAHIGAILRRL